MKKIIISSVMVLAVAAIAGYATYSFFSDTETSTGNNFTAGSLDLRFQADGKAAPFADVNGAALFSGENVFNGDLKPGDQGEKTVKLWVDNNPACGNVTVNLTEDKDNSCTEPELLDDTTCVATDTEGELNDAINFAIWADPNCDNVLGEEESILTTGTLTEDKTYNIGELPITEANAQCYGIAYCFGTWNTDGTCDGSIVNNASQTDSFKADIIINALQKRNQFDAGCPVDFEQGPTEETRNVSLENKGENWQVLSDDKIYGDIEYSHNAKTFHGVVTGTGLVPDGKYQITLNGPGEASGTCGFTNLSLGNFVDNNAFQGGFWNSAWPNLSLNCTVNDEEGLYNMNLIGDHYTFIANGTGAFNYPFNLSLPAGDYSGVKVLVKKMLDTHVSPWVDSTAVHTSNLFEVAPISFTVLP